MNYEELIYKTAKAEGMPHTLALLIVAQSKLETGNYTSNIFKTGNNAFGYMYSKASKYQTGQGPIADNHYPAAKYKNVEDSTRELTSWIKRRQADGQFPKDLTGIKTPLIYATYLKNGAHPYMGASISSYANGMTVWLKKIPKEILVGGSGGLLLLILGAFLFLK